MEDKLGTFISSLQANPNIAGLPDSTTLRNVFYDKEKAEVLFKSLKSNPNIMGLPEDYDTFAEGLGLSEQLQRPVMPELPTEEILDKRQKTNTSRSLPIYRGIAGNIPAAIFNKKLDKAVEKGELPEEDAKEIKKITEQNKWGDLGRSLGVSVLGAGEMALKIPQGLGGLAADISTRIQFPGMNRQINKAVKEGKMTVEQVNELWKTLQSPAFNPKTGQFEQGFIYGENLAESKLTKWFEDNQQKLKEQMTYTDKEIWDYIKEGDIEKAIWATAYGVTESLVPTILAAFTKQGAALLGLGTGSVAYDEVKDREDMMANKKIIDAVGQGVFEWFFEALFTKQMGDQFKAILKAKGTEGLKAAINSEATKNLIGKAFKKFGVWFNPVGEGVSELLTTLGQNAVAKYTGEDPTRKISDGAIDALIVGMGMGGGFSAIEGVAKKFKKRPSDGQRTEDPVKPPTDDTTTEKQSTLDDIREQAKSEEQRIANEAKEMTREGTDEISFVTLANDSGDIAEKPRYVLKDAINEGKKEVVLLEIDPEGKLTGKKVMKMVSDLDVDKETGKVAMTTVKADEHIAAQINTMRETAQSAMNIMAKELSGLNEGDIFSEDGIRYVIEEVSTDGVAVSRLNEEGYVTGESELWSPDEVKEAMNAPTPADTQQAAPAEKVQQEAPETGTEEVDQPTTPQEQQQAAPVEQTQPQEQEQEQQKVEYPKDKEGNIDYNQITETGTYAEALEQEFGETSVSIVDEFIKNINEDIEKAGKGKDPIKKAREIKKLNDRLAFLDGVRNIIAPVREQELTDKARETTEQLEQVQERPPVQEAQVETVVPETKAADTARPINTRSKRKGWPMSKADQERLIKEPQSFEEAVLQFFLGGGRMSMDDYYTHFGKSREEMRKNIWMYSKKGQRLDALNENSIFASYPHLLRGLDGPMDMENAVFEVIRSHSGKNSIRERLDEIQNKPLEPEVPEDIQAEQNTDFEVENSEITGNDVIDEQLLSIFEEYYDNGEIDFSRLSEDLENDVGWFTVFPYNLSEQETNELKNILENADKRTKITDRVRNIVEPESGSQRDDTRDRTEEVERGDSGDRIPRVAETEATGTTPDTRAVESETLTEQESDKLKTGEQTELLFPDQEAIPQEPSETDSKDVAQFQIVQEENPLVVLHNTTEDKLIKSNRAGGLAMPSIAITKPSIGLSGFGDITLIGSKEVIDPQRTGTNKVYGADAYTPRYPNVVYTIGDKNALNNALKDIKDESIKNDIISGIENHIEREGDSYFDENKSVQLAFALNKGADVIVMRKTDLPREVIDFAEKTEGYDYLSIQGNEKAKTELNNVLLNSLDNKTKTLFERTGALKDGQISEKTLGSYFNEAKNWIRARNKVDFYGSEQNARDYIQKNNLQNEVKRFARDLYEQLNVNEKIFRGYTRTGNRRYAPHTVENAVREMKTEGNQGAENFFAGGLSYVRAILAPRFKSIDQIKDASSRLVDNATSKAEFDRLDNLHKSLIEEIKPYYKYVADWFNEATAFGEEIKDLVKNGHSESFNQIPNELQAKIKQFAEDVVALPIDYFEAKPERGVMLSEFTAAVVPENTDSRVISILENNGLKVHKYGDNNRMEVVDRVSKDNNVLFQIAKLEAENPSINYRRLAGEVEARNTETREGFTPEQRRETLLSETEDVAREEQIVLRQVLGEQSRTSPITETILELLEKAGIEVVIEKEAYNKAKKELLKANGVELKDGKGKVYGFAYQEKIYLDPDLVNPNTPIHEYTHLWDMALMKMDLELWDKGINLLKQTPEWNRVVNDPNYANIRHSDDLIASEVHARLVGKDGPAILQEMIDNAKAESPVSHMEALSVVDRIKRWLKQVYVKLFGNKVKNSGDLTLEQWISMPIKDLFEGKRITGEYLEKSPENVKFTDKTEQHGSEGQQREQGTEVPRTPRLGSEQERSDETRQILDELRHDVRGEGQDSGGTTATDNEAEGGERRKLQALATAEVRAKETGAWIGRNELSEIIDDGYRFTSGQESEVYLSKDRKSVIKLNNLSITSSIDSFLFRIDEHNKKFPETTYKIIGFSENAEGEFCIVLKQPFIGNTKEASRQQIDDYFRDKGWYKIIDGEYTDGYVEMWDVYPKNVLTDEAGNLYFIDVNIDPARERYQKYKLPDIPQMEVRPAKEFVKDGVFDVNGYLNSLPERPNVPVDILQSKSEKVVEHLQDRGLSLKKLQDLVKEKGNFDPKNMDAYMRENLSHGMAKNASKLLGQVKVQ